MKTRLMFMMGESGNVGLEAPMSDSTLAEIREAFTALLNMARTRGYITDVPPSGDPQGSFMVTINHWPPLESKS